MYVYSIKFETAECFLHACQISDDVQLPTSFTAVQLHHAEVKVKPIAHIRAAKLVYNPLQITHHVVAQVRSFLSNWQNNELNSVFLRVLAEHKFSGHASSEHWRNKDNFKWDLIDPSASISALLNSEIVDWWVNELRFFL